MMILAGLLYAFMMYLFGLKFRLSWMNRNIWLPYFATLGMLFILFGVPLMYERLSPGAATLTLFIGLLASAVGWLVPDVLRELYGQDGDVP